MYKQFTLDCGIKRFEPNQNLRPIDRQYKLTLRSAEFKMDRCTSFDKCSLGEGGCLEDDHCQPGLQCVEGIQDLVPGLRNLDRSIKKFMCSSTINYGNSFPSEVECIN